MTTIRVSSGYTPPENAYVEADPGPHVVTLVAITEPREVDDTFKGGKRLVQEWQFAIDGGPYDGQMIWDSWVTAPKDGNVHPKSNFYGYMTALFGRTVPEGTDLDIERHLIGRQALATTEKSEQGFVRIVNLGALPAALSKGKAAAPAAPPLREQVAASNDGLPF